MTDLLVCNSCGESFSEEDICRWSEEYERYYGSPCCKEYYDDAVQCAQCREVFASGSLQCKLCRDCREEAIQKFRYFLNNEFTEAEREWLNEYYAGEELS